MWKVNCVSVDCISRIKQHLLCNSLEEYAGPNYRYATFSTENNSRLKHEKRRCDKERKKNILPFSGLVIQLQPNLPTTARTSSTCSLLKNSHHVLRQLLPDTTNHQHYNLRLRRHNLTSSVETDSRNFVVRGNCLETFTNCSHTS